MKKFLFAARIALLGLIASTLTARSHAATVYFSEVGMPVLSNPADPDSSYVAPSALTVGGVPTITMNVGETKTLNVWLRPDNTPSQKYLAAAFDIVSSNTKAHATSYTVLNPEIRNTDDGDPNTPPFARWDGIVLDSVGGVGSTDWVKNAAGLSILQPGIGINLSAFADDPGRDTTTRSFLLGTVTFTADAAGEVGLYFRTGRSKTTIAPAAASVGLQFGSNVPSPLYAGNTPGLGDAITADLALADAKIIVNGVVVDTPVVTATAHDGTSLAGDIVFNGSPNATFIDAGGRTAGRINVVNYIGQSGGDYLPLFFDLVNGASAAQLVADLNAKANGQYVAALSSFGGADLSLIFPGRGAPGSDQFVDFDFGTVAVARVGVPEPASLTLAAMSLVGLVGYGIRRRRA